jgi:hypothetical protein
MAVSCHVDQRAVILVYTHRFNKIFNSRAIYRTIRRRYMSSYAVSCISLRDAVITRRMSIIRGNETLSSSGKSNSIRGGQNLYAIIYLFRYCKFQYFMYYFRL